MNVWLIYTLISVVFMAGMVLILKKLTLQGINAAVILFILFSVAAFVFGGHLLVTRTKLDVSFWPLILIVIAAVFSYVANLLQVKSIALAPNPGYVFAIVSLNVVLVTVMSYFLFASEISVLKGVGIVLGVIAVILISW